MLILKVNLSLLKSLDIIRIGRTNKAEEEYIPDY